MGIFHGAYDSEGPSEKCKTASGWEATLESTRAADRPPPPIPPIVTAGCSFIGGCTPWLQRDTLLLFFYFVRLNWLFTYCPSPTAGCDVCCTHSCAVPQTLLFYIMKTIASENVFNQQNSNRDFPYPAFVKFCGLFISSESRHTTCCVGAEHLSHFVMGSGRV